MLKVTSPRHWVELGATPRAIQRAAAGGAEALEQLKERIRANYRELMREHHPDVGGDLEQAKSLNVAYEEIQAIQYQAPPLPRPNITIVYAGPLYSAPFEHGVTTTTPPRPFLFWWGT